MKILITVVILMGSALAQNSPEEGKVVQYQLDRKELKYTYSASYQPVARLKSGNILETTTVDCFGDAHQEARRHAQHGSGRQSFDWSVLH